LEVSFDSLLVERAKFIKANFGVMEKRAKKGETRRVRGSGEKGAFTEGI